MTKAMKKIFLSVVGVVTVGCILSASVYGTNPAKLTDAQVEELMININNEISANDIPALEDKVVVVDENWNVVLEQSLAKLEDKGSSSEERKLIRKSEFLMEYAGNSYFIIEN
jgi:hypothetical protein